MDKLVVTLVPIAGEEIYGQLSGLYAFSHMAGVGAAFGICRSLKAGVLLALIEEYSLFLGEIVKLILRLNLFCVYRDLEEHAPHRVTPGGEAGGDILVQGHVVGVHGVAVGIAVEIHGGKVLGGVRYVFRVNLHKDVLIALLGLDEFVVALIHAACNVDQPQAACSYAVTHVDCREVPLWRSGLGFRLGGRLGIGVGVLGVSVGLCFGALCAAFGFLRFAAV